MAFAGEMAAVQTASGAIVGSPMPSSEDTDLLPMMMSEVMDFFVLEN